MILKEYVSPNTPILMDYFKGIEVPFALDRLHYHPYHEISVVVKGNITYATKNSIAKACDHCVIFSRAQELHNPFVDQTQVYERYQIKFHTKLISDTIIDSLVLEEALKESYIKQLNEKEFNNLLFGVKSLYSLIQKKSENDSVKLQEALQLILLIISGHNANSLEIETENNYINDVTDYIKHNYNNPITLGSIASHFYISKSKLIYDFRNYCNMSILEYITMTRIEYAKEYLIKGYSVSATAEKCGFSSSSYFIKIFSKVTNTTPLKFQMQHSTYQD